VHKIGPYCWVAWYDGIEKVLLRRDGTAVSGGFVYRWTLDTPGVDDKKADQAWFDKYCFDGSEP